MKKFYAFLAAALISVSAFAAKDVVPSDEVLADYYDQGKVCVCIFVPADMACYDVVLTGKFNEWSTDVAACAKFEAVEGYDGWYVTSFEPEAEPDAEKGIQAKPVMLDGDGNFNWAYQVGAATLIRGGVQVVQGLPGEIDLVNYGTDAPNVYTVDAWKENPCTAIYHNYTVQVISTGCDFLAVPFIIGGMNNWSAPQEMQIDQAKTTELEVPVYYLTFKAAEGTEYQLLSGLRDVTTGGIDSTAQPGWSDECYLQVLVDDVWSRYNPDNSKLGEEALVVYDLRVDTMRWARCAPAEPDEYVIVAVNLPAENRPEAGVEIIGAFDSWEGTPMELLETGWFFVEIEAKASQFFKFRSAGSWDQELELYNAEEDTWAKIADNQLVFSKLWSDDTYKGVACKWIELDFSDPDKARWTTAEGIENVVLTEKAQKVVVDGVLYIVRDNKMFNIQGGQVR
jgi:hypothetical protein